MFMRVKWIWPVFTYHLTDNWVDNILRRDEQGIPPREATEENSQMKFEVWSLKFEVERLNDWKVERWKFGRFEMKT